MSQNNGIVAGILKLVGIVALIAIFGKTASCAAGMIYQSGHDAATAELQPQIDDSTVRLEEADNALDTMARELIERKNETSRLSTQHANNPEPPKVSTLRVVQCRASSTKPTHVLEFDFDGFTTVNCGTQTQIAVWSVTYEASGLAIVTRK